MDPDANASSPAKKEAKQDNPRFMKGFSKLMFLGKVKKGDDVTGRKARSVITAKKNQRKEEAKDLKATTTLLKKGGAKKGGKREREGGDVDSHRVAGEGAEDDGYANLEDEEDGQNGTHQREEDRYHDANFEHQPNGLDVMFATVQRNPALMHPPQDRFACREGLVSGSLYKEALALEASYNILCENEEAIRAKEVASRPDTTDATSRLAQMTSPSHQRQRAASAGKKRDMEVRTMLSLLGAKLGEGSSSKAHHSSTKADVNDSAETLQLQAREKELQDINSQKNEVQSKYVQVATSKMASATHHHKQLDAYLTCLLEFNHGIFGTLPLKDTLYNCTRLTKTDAGMRVLTFEEHTKAMRKRRIEKEMEKAFWSTSSPQQQASSKPATTTTDFDIEQIQMRALAAIEPNRAQVSSVGPPGGGGGGGVPEDWEDIVGKEYDDNGDYEAELAAESYFDNNDSAPHRPDEEMDPYEYLMLYGVPPPSMMGNNTNANASIADNAAANGLKEASDTPLAPAEEELSVAPTDGEGGSTFTATLHVGVESEDVNA